jgi:hypothetical protein
MLSAKTIEILSTFDPKSFSEAVDWMLLDYRLPEHAGAAAAAAERVKEFAECKTWVRRGPGGTLTATFTAFAGRPELTVPLYQCIRLPGSGTGIFADVSVIGVLELVPTWKTYLLGEPEKAVYHLYLFSTKRGLSYAHPLQDMADYF